MADKQRQQKRPTEEPRKKKAAPSSNPNDGGQGTTKNQMDQDFKPNNLWAISS